jgi:hypothetical protein
MFLKPEPRAPIARTMAQILYIENMPNTLTNIVETFLSFRANVVVLRQRVRASLAPSNPPLPLQLLAQVLWHLPFLYLLVT